MQHLRALQLIAIALPLTLIAADPKPSRVFIGVLIESSQSDVFALHHTVTNLALEKVNSDSRLNKIRLNAVVKQYNSTCDTTTAPAIAAEIYHNHNVSALFGDFCDEALEHITHLAASWNIPVITGSGAACTFTDKSKFPTLTRLSISHCPWGEVFNSILQTFSWSNITVISDSANVQYNISGRSINDGLNNKGYNSQLLIHDTKNNEGRQELLRKASERSRVIIISAGPGELHNILQAAWDLGYILSGQYVFLHYDLDGKYKVASSLASKVDQKDLKLYDALLTIKPDIEESKQLKRFRKAIIRRLRSTFGQDEVQVDFAAGAIFDSIVIYALVLNQSVGEENFDFKDGLTMSSNYIWGREYDGVTGHITIDENGDRLFNFSVNDLNMKSAEFEPVAYYNFNEQRYNPEDYAAIHWPGLSNTPPLNEPKCGYKNECKKSYSYIPAVVGYGALVTAIFILSCIIILTIVQLCKRCMSKYGTVV